MEVEEDGWTEGEINEKSWGKDALLQKEKNAGRRAAGRRAAVRNRAFTEEDRDVER